MAPRRSGIITRYLQHTACVTIYFSSARAHHMMPGAHACSRNSFTYSRQICAPQLLQNLPAKVPLANIFAPHSPQNIGLAACCIGPFVSRFTIIPWMGRRSFRIRRRTCSFPDHQHAASWKCSSVPDKAERRQPRRPLSRHPLARLPEKQLVIRKAFLASRLATQQPRGRIAAGFPGLLFAVARPLAVAGLPPVRSDPTRL